jgi:hypothetical protein
VSISADYLTAEVNTAAVTRHYGVEAFVNMSQMTVTQMSITGVPPRRREDPAMRVMTIM